MTVVVLEKVRGHIRGLCPTSHVARWAPRCGRDCRWRRRRAGGCGAGGASRGRRCRHGRASHCSGRSRCGRRASGCRGAGGRVDAGIAVIDAAIVERQTQRIAVARDPRRISIAPVK